LAELKLQKLRELKALRAEKGRRESAALADVDVFAILGYEPHPKQREFHSATEFDVLYGGSAGGGKSFAIVAEGVKNAARYPGMRVLVVRRTYDELNESIFPALRKFDYAKALGATWNGSERELRFPNGSVIRFRYLETLDDASRRQGGEYQLLLVDEATLMPPGVVDILRYERLRSSGDIPIIGVRSTTNPGGPSHGEVKKRYIEATDHGAMVATDDNGLTVRFIQARATDNPHLDEGYHRRLDAIPDPQRRAAMRDGDWGQFSGQMFTEFRWDRHVIDPITLPAQWKRYNGVDWGYTKPWAVLWAAIDEDTRLWFYREIYETQVGEAEQARMILAAEAAGEQVSGRFADDAMWATRGDAKPIADIYSENGVWLTAAGKGPGSRVAGWQRWHSYLAEGPACPHHRAMGWPTCPRVHIFRTCPTLLFELENLPYATKGANPEDADTHAPDHAMDAGRYLLLNVGSEPGWVFPSEMPADALDGPPDPNAVDPAAAVPAVPNIGGFPILHGNSPWGAAY
jgi:PBSX family phage terminase large subunit